MKKALRAIYMAMAALVFLGGCASNPVQESMASFDRAYIPALMLTAKKDNTGQNIMAVKQLKLEWNLFRSRNPGLADEGGSAQGVEGLIMKADGLMNIGKYREAHKTLVKIEKIMREARVAAGIVYFPDRLAEFHDVMEEIVAVASKSPARVSILMPDAISAWRVVQKARFNRGFFRFTSDQKERLRKLIDDEAQLLKALLAAAVSNDRKKVAGLANEVMAKYTTIYRMFGNFQGASLGG